MKPFFHEVIPFVYSITAWFGRDPPRNFPWPTREKSHPHQPMWSPSSPKISVEKSHGSAQHRASPPGGSHSLRKKQEKTRKNWVTLQVLAHRCGKQNMVSRKTKMIYKW
jgi:hypothetical protein